MQEGIHAIAIVLCLATMVLTGQYIFNVYQHELTRELALAEAKWERQRVAADMEAVLHQKRLDEAVAMLARQEVRLAADADEDKRGFVLTSAPSQVPLQ